MEIQHCLCPKSPHLDKNNLVWPLLAGMVSAMFIIIIVFIFVYLILQFSLWGNKFDLSVFSGEVLLQHAQLDTKLHDMKKKILSNNTQQAWKVICDSENGRVDFILDNAGFELFSDLCLAEFLLNLEKTSVVHLHVKDVPWFVSDTTEKDLFWTLNQLKNSSLEVLSKLGHQWLERIEDGSFLIRKHRFWTVCHDYSLMKTHAPELYEDLSKSKMLFFKGDLNYRKLVGDRNWPYTTPFDYALWGFCPAPLCALRTIKAEVVVGLEEGKAEEALAADKNWMITGEFAVVETSINVQ